MEAEEAEEEEAQRVAPWAARAAVSSEVLAAEPVLQKALSPALRPACHRERGRTKSHRYRRCFGPEPFPPSA